eukprot:TRINITY_DN8408_c0_g1_i16.p1 TRINITY_DN8408_c0_g1~~TRINITY_DN8408_c0_g1_i16.p1  ORF type:complete len:535 (+),score=155.60 TRINITY_DN8408_c0_g1_i16:73-1677(+)
MCIRDRHGINGSRLLLLQLLDPWETNKWTGNWSENSPTWTSEAIRVLGKKGIVGTHRFYIALEDYLGFYQSTTVCYLPSNSQFVKEVECTQAPGDCSLIKVQVKEPTTGLFTIAQKPLRIMSKKYVNYKISEISLMIAKKDGSDFKFIKGEVGCNENYTVKINGTMNKGEYVILLEANWCCEGVDSFVFNAYTSRQTELVRMSSREFPGYIEKVLKSCAVINTEPKTYANKHEPMIKKYASINGSNAGYGYIYYKNDSEDTILYEAITFKKLKNIKASVKGKKIDIRLNPNQDKIIVLKKTGPMARYSLDKITKLRFTKAKLIKLLKSHGSAKKLADGDVSIVKLSHDFGYVWGCRNDSDETYFAAKFEFNLQNLKFDEEDANFEIELPPGEEVVKFLWKIDETQSSGYKYSYTPYFNDLSPLPKHKVQPELKKSAELHQIRNRNEPIPVQYYTLYRNGWYYWYFINGSKKSFGARLEFTLDNLELVDEYGSEWEVQLDAGEELMKHLRAVDYKQPIGYQVVITVHCLILAMNV